MKGLDDQGQEAIRSQDRGAVDNGSGRVGGGNALEGTPIAGFKANAVNHAEPASTGRTWRCGEVGQRWGSGSEAAGRSCGQVRGEPSGMAQTGGGRVLFPRGWHPSQRVGSLAEPTPSPVGQGRSRLSGGEAGCQRLGSGEGTMLVEGQGGDAASRCRSWSHDGEGV